MRFVDTHAHLDRADFDADRAEVLQRAMAAGVRDIVTMGTTAESSALAARIANQYYGVWAAVGIHPNDCAGAAPDDWDRIVKLAAAKRVVAIGETGLDRYWNDAPFDLQRDYFDRHLRLAADAGLPFVVHTRDCGRDVLAMLRDERRRKGSPLSGVMHSFTVDVDWLAGGGDAAGMAAECVDLGLFISFAGMATFKKSADLRAVAATIPADRILVETDSPYLSPHPLRGRRNEPAHVVHTARCLAATRGVPPDVFADQTTDNARRLFGLAIGATGDSCDSVTL